MTDKEKITAEIERCENICDEFIKAHPDPIDSGIARAKINMCKHIKAFIDSKQEEPVSEDLEKEFDDIYYQLEKVDAQNDGFGGRYKGYKFALKIARHFANWQKQQMMKEAVDGTVFTQLEDGKIMVRSHYFKSEKIKYLDNVKLIIIKEEGYGKVK